MSFKLTALQHFVTSNRLASSSFCRDESRNNKQNNFFISEWRRTLKVL